MLINDWEACFFKFTREKLLKLARRAKKLGVELFVLDDGWFGARNSDTAGLGDYDVNLRKLPGGLGQNILRHAALTNHQGGIQIICLCAQIGALFAGQHNSFSFFVPNAFSTKARSARARWDT